MKENFSLKYDRKEFKAENGKSVSEGIEYELEKGITVTAKINKHDEYDAVEWVLWFENSSDKNSKMISDIYDCDILLPLNIPKSPEPGYMPKEENLCVITMTGMVESGYYWENDKISATEYGLNREYLDKAKNKTKCFCNIGGRSSEGMMPVGMENVQCVIIRLRVIGLNIQERGILIKMFTRMN